MVVWTRFFPRASAAVLAAALTTAAIFLSADLCPARAADPQVERLSYNIMFGGLHVGDILVALDQTETGYRTEMRAQSRGLLERFVDVRADLQGEGSFLNASIQGALQPELFKRQWTSTEIISTVAVSYDPVTKVAQSQELFVDRATGDAVPREKLPWRGSRTPRIVPLEKRTDVLDPMAAFVAARQQVRAGSRQFRMPVYDGQRRYDIIGTVGAPRAYTFADGEKTLIPVSTKMEAIAGFSPRSAERMGESEGRSLFTTDGRFIPYQVMIGNDIATVVMNLVADCKTDGEACKIFDRPTAP